MHSYSFVNFSIRLQGQTNNVAVALFLFSHVLPMAPCMNSYWLRLPFTTGCLIVSKTPLNYDKTLFLRRKKNNRKIRSDRQKGFLIPLTQFREINIFQETQSFEHIRCELTAATTAAAAVAFTAVATQPPCCQFRNTIYFLVETRP